MEAQAGKMGAEEHAAYFLRTANNITANRLSRLSLIITNICLIMEALGRILTKTLGLEHILTIPCNSYSLQLLIKDIL
jgi:hypothetical protein